MSSSDGSSRAGRAGGDAPAPGALLDVSPQQLQQQLDLLGFSGLAPTE
jgi:hypothetical protein